MKTAALSLLIAQFQQTQTHAAKCGDFFYNKCSSSSKEARYDPDSSINLKDQDVIYEKLEGFWIGNYTFYNGDGDVMPSSLYDEMYGYGWPYEYDSYRGAINITIVGSRFYQHNYFFYPPASAEFCSANANPPSGKKNAYGSGVCGVNGGFKSFDAFGTSSYERDGTMHSLAGAGTYANFVNIAYPIDNNTLLYTSTDDITQFHSQMNVFYPDDKHRTRTAYGFDYITPGKDSALMYSSLYKEWKVSEEDFLKALNDFGSTYNVPNEDIASFPMQTSCLIGNWAGGIGVECPTEADFCTIDPSCSESPYKADEPTLSMPKVTGFIVGVFVLLIIALVLFFRKRIHDTRVSARAKFAKALVSSSKWNSTSSPEELLKLFQQIDTSGDGLISKEELRVFMSKYDISDKEFDVLFDSADQDNSGKVDFAEFSAILVNAQGLSSKTDQFVDSGSGGSEHSC